VRFVVAFVVAVVLLLGCRPGGAAAQTRVDSAAVLLETARRFEGMGRLDVADALYEHILERFRDTPAAATVQQIRVAMPVDRGARSGRVELQVWSTLYGAALGLALPEMFGADNAEIFGIGLLLGAPAGFLVARGYARSRQLTEGQARAITFGGTWGAWQGLGWAIALELGEDDIGGEEPYVDAAVLGSFVGIAAGAILGRKPIPTGLATTVNFGALWGTWFGVAAGVLAGASDGVLDASLIGGNAGLIATAILAPRWQMSRNRARLVSVGGLLGGIAGAGALLIVQPDDEKVAIMFPLAGSVAGLWLGAVRTRDHDRGGAAPGGGESGALLDWRAGRLGLGTPVPYPTLLRTDRGRTGTSPAIGVTLLRARF
jgi:hypothetical protein